MIKKYWLLCIIMVSSLLLTQISSSNPQVDLNDDKIVTKEDAEKWKTPGFQQANSMGGGEGAISKTGKLRVFLLMGQPNMAGAAKATELKSPYNKKHDRIRIWANGR